MKDIIITGEQLVSRLRQGATVYTLEGRLSMDDLERPSELFILDGQLIVSILDTLEKP